MTDEQYEIIIGELRDVKRRLDDIESNRSKDMEKIQDLTIKSENLESEVKAVRQAINRSSENIKNSVADVVEPVVGAAQDLTTEIKKKKMFVLKQDSWWNRLFRRNERKD